MLGLLVCVIFLLLQSSIERIKHFYCSVAQHDMKSSARILLVASRKYIVCSETVLSLEISMLPLVVFSVKTIIETACTMLEAFQGGGKSCA